MVPKVNDSKGEFANYILETPCKSKLERFVRWRLFEHVKPCSYNVPAHYDTYVVRLLLFSPVQNREGPEGGSSFAFQISVSFIGI